MSRLADLASCVVLSLCVRVGGKLHDKYDKKQSQAAGQQPGKFPSRFRLADHFES